VPWTKEEKKSIFSRLNAFVIEGKVPGKLACEECIAASKEALQARSWSAKLTEGKGCRLLFVKLQYVALIPDTFIIPREL